jgi:DNA-directed RNA polymerase subunit beta'
MRTFHIGGAASSSVEQSNAVAPIQGNIVFENVRLIKDRANNQIILTRNAKIKIFLDDDEKFSFNIPFGSNLSLSYLIFL